MIWQNQCGRIEVVFRYNQVGKIHEFVVVRDLMLQPCQGVQPGLDFEAVHERAYRGDIDATAAVLDSHFLDQDAIPFKGHNTAKPWKQSCPDRVVPVDAHTASQKTGAIVPTVSTRR